MNGIPGMKLILDSRGMTCEEASQLTGLRFELINTLYLGKGTGKTLPSLARQIRDRMGLTDEEYQSISQPLNQDRAKAFLDEMTFSNLRRA